jgi:NADH dehydrogenase FAD-containing subunit
MAAALAIFVRTSLRSEFRRIDPTSARIVLIDAAPNVLGMFAPSLSEAAEFHLQKLGVEIHLGHAVEKIDSEGVIVAGERIASKTVIWTAGVTPSPAGKWLGVETDRAGRVRIQPDLRVPNHPEIFVIGDTASLDQDGKPLAGVAQVAMQQGRYAGKLIRRQLLGKKAPKPFRYFDKGTMAVVGKGYAVLQSGKIRLHGLFAWLAWAFIHITFLSQLSLKISVFLQWGWVFLTGQRGSRLIVNYQQSEPAQTTPPSPATKDRRAQPARLETTLTK